MLYYIFAALKTGESAATKHKPTTLGETQAAIFLAFDAISLNDMRYQPTYWIVPIVKKTK